MCLIALDAPLSQIGLKQADAVGWRLREVEFDQIYTSDLAKCKQTALAILKCNTAYKSQPKPEAELLQQLSIDGRLRERVHIKHRVANIE